MNLPIRFIVLICLTPLCGFSEPSFNQSRAGFITHLLREEKLGEPAEAPPPGDLDLVSYPAPLGLNVAYVSPRPSSGGRHPAIIWLVGGLSNSIGSVAWAVSSRQNDQSAAAFRRSGIVTMYPSVRGGNDNPGFRETFLGEVDDVLAAARYLARLDYVDPDRIYLGGHSTGGTLALLVAAASGDRFRAIFALGPVGNVAGYGADSLPFDLRDSKELSLRSPANWLADIARPTFVFEGTAAPSNIGPLHALQVACHNPRVAFEPVEGATHFTLIAPLVGRLAAGILADTASQAAFHLPTATADAH